MDRLSESGAIAGSKELWTCRAAVAPPPRTAPPRPDGRASLSPDPASPAARDLRGCTLPFARRFSLRRRLHPRENAATLAALRDAQRQSWRLRSAHWSRRARERKAESRCRAFPLRLQSAEWRPARVGSHAALGPSKVSGDVGPCVAGESGPGLATLTCGKATPACACWYARAE